MHYIDYLKIYIKVYAWMLSATIVVYTIMCFFGLIRPIHIPIGAIIANFAIPMFLAPFWQWRNSCKK